MRRRRVPEGCPDVSTRSRAEHVLVVVLDTVRAESTFLGGRDLTPTLERVADGGVSFERAVTPAPWTLPAHASIYTGKYPTEHGATHRNMWLSDAHPRLPEQMHDAGLRTGLFTPNAFLTGSFNMDGGFEEVVFARGEANKLFDDGLDPVRFLNEREHETGVARYREILRAVADGPILRNVANALYFRYREASRDTAAGEQAGWDERAVDAAASFLADAVAADERFFAVVNLVGAHAPWAFDRERLGELGVVPEDLASPERWRTVAENSGAQWRYAAGELEFDDVDREILQHLYEAWIRAVDGLAGRLVATLDELGVREETLVVLTADHGECLARDGVLGHSVTVDPSVARVPLVLDGPTLPAETVSAPVSLKDLYGTLRSRAGIADGRDLLDEDVQGVALSETHGVDPDRIDEPYREAAARFGRRRALYADGGHVERREDGTVLGEESLLARLDGVVSDLEPFGETAEAADLEGDVEDRLRELGYLG